MLKQLAPIFLLGIAEEAVWLALIQSGPLRENFWQFLGLILAAFLICLCSFWRAPLRQKHSVPLMLLFALAFRMTCLPASPDQSEDVYRYLWDARVASAGVDPYRFQPRAPELEHLRDPNIYPMLNTKAYLTSYPPLSQLLFRCSYSLFGARVVPMKAMFSLLEFCALLIAWRLLVLLGRKPEPLYLMAWNPFFIFEFSHSGHSDSGMIFFILLSFLLLLQCRKGSAMACYAGAVLSKLHPALCFPLYLRRVGWRAGSLGILAGGLVALAYFTPRSGLQYLSSLRLYYGLFEFNAGIHYLLTSLGNALFQQSWHQATGPFLISALILITGAICWRFPRRDVPDLIHAGFWIMVADLCLSTTVHPWYLSWAALALFIYPYAFMVYWTSAVFLSYIAYSYRPVFEPTWVLLLEYLPVFFLMGWEIIRGGPLLAQDRRENRQR